MSVISIRLPEELERMLAREAELAQKARSEVARDAIADYLARQERERFLAEIARAARARGSDDAVKLAEEALPLDNEAMDLAEGRVAHQSKPSYRTGKTRRR